MGPSGCGKSTLLNLLAGLDRPTAGEVWLDGKRIDGLSETALARLRRRKVGFVFQFFNLVPTLTAVENVELPLAPRRPPAPRGSTVRERADERSGHSGEGRKPLRPSCPVGSSSGSRWRARWRTALTSCSRTSRPATSTRQRRATCWGSCARRADRGQTLLLVTHDASVASAADRVVTLRDGLVADETELAAARQVAPLLELRGAE